MGGSSLQPRPSQAAQQLSMPQQAPSQPAQSGLGSVAQLHQPQQALGQSEAQGLQARILQPADSLPKSLPASAAQPSPSQASSRPLQQQQGAGPSPVRAASLQSARSASQPLQQRREIQPAGKAAESHADALDRCVIWCWTAACSQAGALHVLIVLVALQLHRCLHRGFRGR